MTATRKRYPADHWSQAAPTRELLVRYLEGNRRTYNRTKAALICRGLEADLTGRTVLDYGGGGGFMSVLLAERGARVTLIDAEANALELARMLARDRRVEDRITFLRAEALPEELAQRRFDVVLAKDVLEHMEDDDGFLRAVARCQRPGDRLIVSTQNRWSLNFLLEGTYQRWWCGERDWCGWDPTHVRFYTPPLLRRRLRRAGYVPTRWSGLYIVPYDILSWFLLLRKRIVLDGLHRLDLAVGHRYPFNRFGWNLVVFARRAGH